MDRANLLSITLTGVRRKDQNGKSGTQLHALGSIAVVELEERTSTKRSWELTRSWEQDRLFFPCVAGWGGVGVVGKALSLGGGFGAREASSHDVP